MANYKALTKITNTVFVAAIILHKIRCIRVCSVFKRYCIFAYIGVTKGEGKGGDAHPIFFSA